MIGVQVSEELKEYPLNPTKIRINGSSNELSVEKLMNNIQKVASSNSTRRFSASGFQKPLIRYRLMVFLQSLNEIPADIDLKKNYYIEYNLFDQKLKYKLDVSNIQRKGRQNWLPINKVKVFYLFSPAPKLLGEFFSEEKVFFLTAS